MHVSRLGCVGPGGLRRLVLDRAGGTQEARVGVDVSGEAEIGELEQERLLARDEHVPWRDVSVEYRMIEEVSRAETGRALRGHPERLDDLDRMRRAINARALRSQRRRHLCPGVGGAGFGRTQNLRTHRSPDDCCHRPNTVFNGDNLT